jgi:hypothetical protein
LSTEEVKEKKTKKEAKPEEPVQAEPKPKRKSPAKKKPETETEVKATSLPETLEAKAVETGPSKVAAIVKREKKPAEPKKKSKAAVKREEQEAKAMKEKGLQALKEYVFLGVTMEELAEKYGFSSWEELYDLYKKTPASEIWAQ